MTKKAIKSFAIAALLLLSVALAAGAQEPQEKASASREALKARVKAGVELRQKSIGWIKLGAQGEWLFMDLSQMLSNDAIYVVREGEGLLLYPVNSPQGSPLGKVAPSGEIAIFDKKLLKGPAVPDRWPVDKKEKRLLVPKSGDVITKPTGTAKSRKPLPKGFVAVFMLSSTGELVKLPDTAAKTENVIWAIQREDGGIDFIHSGPLKSGVYMHIAPDRKIECPQDREKPPAKGLWPYHKEGGPPIVPPLEGHVIPTDPSADYDILMHSDGTFGVVYPPKED
jgi:hypothetical protein